MLSFIKLTIATFLLLIFVLGRIEGIIGISIIFDPAVVLDIKFSLSSN